MPTERHDWYSPNVGCPDWDDMPEKACCYSVSWRDVWLHLNNLGCTDVEIKEFIHRHFKDIEENLETLMQKHASEIRSVVAKLASENLPKDKVVQEVTG